MEKEAKVVDVRTLDNGSYELRYFLNNSFDTYHALKFDIENIGEDDAYLNLSY